jgi:hypothetical protein
MKRRREFLAGAAGLAAGAAVPSKAAAPSGKVKAPGGYKFGNLYFSSGLSGKGADIKEPTAARSTRRIWRRMDRRSKTCSR